MPLSIERYLVGPLRNNLYLLVDDQAKEAVVIDPSTESQKAFHRMQELQQAGFRLAAIWNTHGHFDHVCDNARWSSEFRAPVFLHREDAFFLDRLKDQALWFGLPVPEPVAVSTWLDGGETLTVGSHTALVVHTPGHSPGSVTFLFKTEGACISGDVLFRGSVGRVDLPGSSPGQLQHSLRLLLELPDATRVLPGHDEETTIGNERAFNPYCHNLAIPSEEILA